MTMITNILQEMKILQGWSEHTYKQYTRNIKAYSDFHNTTFEELLQEAEEDEEKISKVQKRRIKQRLTSYILYLHEEGKSNNTINTYLANVKQVYLHQDIEIPRLPSITKQEKESYTDLLTKQEITRAIENSNTKMKAIITTLASTGLRISDLVQITVHEFLIATKMYHNYEEEDLSDKVVFPILKGLQKKDNIIPMFKIKSVKTNIEHFTFCSPEATYFIIQMLLERYMKKGVCLDENIFDLKSKSVTANFERLSDKLQMKWKTRRRRFHPHALRKWFATTLQNNDVDFLAVEFLLGHTLKSVTSSYYFANPEKIRLKYERVVDELCFVTRVHHVDLVGAEHRELQELKRENRLIRDKLYEVEELLSALRGSSDLI